MAVYTFEYMSGQIPKTFIDDLLARTDIVDVVGGFVTLKKSGSNYKGLCPFHDEKTPSFTVSQDKQFYHCFGCGANGSAISFLMDYNHLDFVSAVEELASRAGLDVPREGGGTVTRDHKSTELYELQELVIQFYKKQLKQHADADRAVNYLKQRGITGELALQFELGYAPAGWDNLIRSLGQSDAAQKRLLEAGLIIQRDTGGFYDRFRDRIIFPIRDQRGRAIGFGGRVLGDGTPKYLNSPETPIFHKGRELYGLYQARHASKNLDRLYIVEGYMDVLALVQHGISNVAATLGTAATGDHLESVFRLTAEIIFCFDGDTAGRTAAWRALETSLPLLRDGRRIFFMFMPQGKDPDDYVRENGKEAFANIKNYVPLSDYLLDELTREFDPGIREHRSKLVHDASQFLQKLPQGSLKQLLIDEIAALANLDRSIINEQLIDSKEIIPAKPARPQRQASRSERTLLAQIVRLLLRKPEIALKIPDHSDLSGINLPGTDFLQELIQYIHENPGITLARILEHWRGTKYGNRLSELAPKTESPYEKDEEIFHTDEYLETELLDAVQRLRELSRKQKLSEFKNISSPVDLSEEQKDRLRNLNPAARIPPEF